MKLTSQSHRLRNRGNRISGFLLGYGMLAALVTVDPLGIHNQYMWLDLTGFFYALGMGMLGFFSYSFFSRPYVLSHGEVLVVQNAFRHWVIPSAAIVSFDFSGKYGRAVLGQRAVRMLATERGNLGRWLGVNRFSGLAGEKRSAGSDPRGGDLAGAKVAWSGLDWHQVIILLGLITYLVVALIYSPQGPR